MTWLGNSAVPQLREPRPFTPSMSSPARLSWISDFVIPQLGSGFGAELGFGADLEEVDEEAVAVARPPPEESRLSNISSSLWEKPDESVLSFPPPSLRRLPAPAAASRQGPDIRSPSPFARDPGPAPDRGLPPTPVFLTGSRLWLVAIALVLAMFCGGMVRPPPSLSL